MEQELWRKYRLRTIVGMLFKTVEVVFDVMTPLIVADMIDVGVATHDAGYVVRRGILLVCMACAGYSSTLVTQHVASKVSQGVGTDMRNALFRKINSFGAAEIDRMERRITEKVYSSHGIILAGIGIYAIDQNCSDIRENILNIVRRHDGVIQIHGIFVDTAAKKLVFDVIIDYERKDKSEIFNAVCEDVQKAYPDWNVSVNLDIDI